MASRHGLQTDTVKESSRHHVLASRLKKLAVGSHRRKADEERDDQCNYNQSRHRHKPEGPQHERHRSSGRIVLLSPVDEEPSPNRHHDLVAQNQPRRTLTVNYRTITEVQHAGAIPNRHSQQRHVSELDDTSRPSSANTSPRLRPPSLDGSTISSLMHLQTRALPDIREMTLDEARIQLRGLQSRLENVESRYYVDKYGPPQRNELKKFEKAAAALHRDCDHLIDRPSMIIRNGITQADVLKGEVERFWEGLLDRLVRQKRLSLNLA